MRRVLAILALLLMSGCEHDAERAAASTNKSVDVELLTQFDGVKVYRFHDGGQVLYVAVASRDTQSAMTSYEYSTYDVATKTSRTQHISLPTVQK